jgi:hypothetical protein
MQAGDMCAGWLEMNSGEEGIKGESVESVGLTQERGEKWRPLE